MNLFDLIILLIILPIIRSTPVYFDDCGSNEIKSIDIEPCQSLPCHFDKGARANLTIVFQPKKRANYLRVYSTLRTGGLFDYQIEIKDDDPEVCQSDVSPQNNWGKIKCPVLSGQTYSFMVSRKFPISTTWNMFRYSKIKLLNEYGETIACADWYLEFNRNAGSN